MRMANETRPRPKPCSRQAAHDQRRAMSGRWPPNAAADCVGAMRGGSSSASRWTTGDPCACGRASPRSRISSSRRSRPSASGARRCSAPSGALRSGRPSARTATGRCASAAPRARPDRHGCRGHERRSATMNHSAPNPKTRPSGSLSSLGTAQGATPAPRLSLRPRTDASRASSISACS